MPPGGQKRKRTERQASDDASGIRPSPYRPQSATLSTESPRQTNGSTNNADSVTPSGDGDLAGSGAASEPVAGARAHNTRLTRSAVDSNPSAVQDTTAADRPTVQFLQPSWNYVTQDIVSTWMEEGMQRLSARAADADEMQIGEIIQELVWSGLNGRLTGQQAGRAIRDINKSGKDRESELQLLFLNTISLLDDNEQSNPNFRALVAATGVDPQVMRQELDIPLLQALNLVRSTFDKMRTRKTTNALYRQANFNLLREESEGYAKLITEYFNTAQDASSRREEDPFSAEDAFQRVKALVGAFDLDVGRVLDITLDVSANLLVKAYPFLMKFYRASSWWPDDRSLDDVKWQDQGFGSLPIWALPGSGVSTSNETDRQQLAALREARDVDFWICARETGLDAFFEIGSRRIIDFESVATLLDADISPELDSRGKETNPSKRLRNQENRKYMRATKTLPPPGNYEAAQLLGFKLRFYASDARDASDVLPDNLVYLAALLIKIGFISLRDLYPHLYPPDAAMPQEKARLEKEKAEKEAKERPGGGANALAMAAALTDDTLPAPRTARSDKDRSGGATPAPDKKDEPKEELPPPQNQKVILLKALLLIGALPEALHMLGRFPWLAEADASMAQYLHRIVKHMLSKVAHSVRPMSDRDGLQEPSEQLADVLAKPDGSLKLMPRPVNKKSTRWLHNDGFDEHGQEYRHYYADWSDNIPVCQSVDDVFVLFNTLIGYLGVRVGQDAILYGTLLHIAKHSLTEDDSSSNRSRWLELLKRLLVPALSLSKHNPELAHELFDILTLFPTETRYNIYTEWFLGRTSRLPDIRSAFARNKAEVRDVLRRVSNDSGKKQSRALAKVAISSPAIVMMEMINQLESYRNMIPSLVECTRYFSHLAQDVLTWCLINSVTGKGRDRIQADGMLTSPWLQALSQFVASLFTRYANLDLSPILQYLASELRAGSSTDLEMFEQILVEMAGIRSDTYYNDYQVAAMAGGKVMQSHIMQQLSDTRHTKKASAKRLIKALAEPGLIGQILVAIAQEQQMYSSRDASKYMPLKVLGSNLDKIQAIFAQYLEVLKHNLRPSEFEVHVPDVITLIKDFGIEPGVALCICRAVIRHHMALNNPNRPVRAEDKMDAVPQKQEESSESLVMESPGPKNEKSGEESAHTSSATPVNGSDTISGELGREQQSTSSPATEPWHPVLEPIIQQLSEIMPALPARVSVPFYVTFWTLTLQDVFGCQHIYKKEKDQLNDEAAKMDSDRSDVSAIVAKERERKKRALKETAHLLEEEQKAHIREHVLVRAWLKNERFHWFTKSTGENANPTKKELDAKHLGLLQECFLPRAMMSSLDALFSFEMLKILHENCATGFSLMHLLHQLFKRQALTALIFQCTAVEAQHIGRFLNEVLKLLHQWHAKEAIYDKEAIQGKRGFVKKFNEDGTAKSTLDFEDFRRMVFNFHAYLNYALQACFESGEYMHIRNGIIVLKAVHQVFPTVQFIGLNMVTHVKKLSEEEQRGDLKLAAMSLLGPLTSREKQWVLPQVFRMSLQDAAKDKDAKGNSIVPSSKTETPQPDSNAPKLNGAATDFNPGTAAHMNGSTTHRDSVAGREDGEIEDEKQADMKSGKLEATPVTQEEGKRNAMPASDIAKPQDLPAGSSETRPKTSRPSTPAGLRPDQSSTAPQRSSAAQITSSRPPSSDIPPRFDSGAGSRPPQASHAGRGGRYPSRSDDRFGRLERPSDVHPASRDESPANRPRGRTPPPIAAARSHYRDDRPPLDTRPSRDDSWNSSRRDPAGYYSRVEDQGPPERTTRFGSVAVPPENRPASRQHAADMTATQPSAQPSDDTPNVNPARLSFINASPASTPGPRGRRDGGHVPENDLRRERDVRADERPQQPPAFNPRADGRTNGRASMDMHRDAPSRFDNQSDLAPTGPKRGRLSRDTGPQESTYGRLNGPAAEAPSGPRQHNGPTSRGGRNAYTAPSSGHIRPNETPAQASDQFKPTDGPATPRGGLSKPPSSATLNQERGTPSNLPPPESAAEAGPAVHPSRASQLGQPPPIQTTFASSGGPRNPASSTAASTPSGPRGTRSGPSTTPTGNSPTNSLPPSGPASAVERQQRRNERQRANINATLSSGANGQGVNFRGASARQSYDGQQPPAESRSAVPTVASSMDPQPARDADNRPFPGEAVSNSNPRPDLFQDKTARNEGGSMRRRGDDRQYSTRDTNREARPDSFDSSFRGPPPPSMGDNQMRRGHPRDDRPPNNNGPPGPRRGPPRGEEMSFRRPGPEGPPPAFAGPPEWERGTDHRTMRRDAGPHENRRGGRMGGSGGRPDDFRAPQHREERREPADRGSARDDLGAPPDTRKRRMDDSTFDSTKRRRGGR